MKYANSHKCALQLAAILVLGVCSLSYGQTNGNVSVQLPTFHQFGVSTTVLVPDRGALYLGGVNSSSHGSSQFGPRVPGLGSRGFSSTSASSGVSISATIIDHDAIDRALLAEAARRRGDQVDIYGRQIAEAPRLSPAVVAQRSAVRARDGRNSLAPVRYGSSQRSHARTDAGRAKTYWQRAQRAEAEGQPHQARVFYRRVIKHGSSARKQQAQAALARLPEPIEQR